MALSDWVRLPSKWINDCGLCHFRWGSTGVGANNIAALMALVPLAHHADGETGTVRMTYDQLCDITGLSRSKLSKGLDVLTSRKIIEPSSEKRSTFRLTEFDPTRDWAKLPAKRLYSGGRIFAFDEFNLRKPAELNALKLYFLFAARRDNRYNLAFITFDQIEEYTGIDRNKIRTGTSLLAALGLIHIEHVPSKKSEHGIANAYRLVGIDPYNHRGTNTRGLDTSEFQSVLDASEVEAELG